MNEAKRYNVFDSFHRGLRTMLFNLEMKWQQTDFTSGAQDTVADLETVLRYYDEYAGYKDQFILGNIIWQEPHIAASFEEDNDNDHKLSGKLREMLSVLKEASPNDKDAAAASVFHALNEFIAFTLYQTNKEETVLLPLLWKHFSDTEIIGMEQLIAASIHTPVLAVESCRTHHSFLNPERKAYVVWKQGCLIFVFNFYKTVLAEATSRADDYHRKTVKSSAPTW